MADSISRETAQQKHEGNSESEHCSRNCGKILHSLGFRFRLHRKDLPGTPDIVLAKHRIAILVHGCFWHQHQRCSVHAPKSRVEYWLPKFERTKERDRDSMRKFNDLGWNTIVVWECEIKDQNALKNRLSRRMRPANRE